METVMGETRPYDASLLAGNSEAAARDVVEASAARDLASERARKPRPAWGWLYAVLPLTVLLFVMADMVPAANGGRTVAELVAAFVVIGAMGFWVRANRLALIAVQYDRQSETTQELR